jgi:hypothetical protein
MADAPMTIVETERFLQDAGSLMSDVEREVHGCESGGRG